MYKFSIYTMDIQITNQFRYAFSLSENEIVSQTENCHFINKTSNQKVESKSVGIIT